MSGVYAQLSMSLDGFVAGPNDRPGNGLGDGGERVHEWVVATAAWRREHGLDGGEDNEESKLVEKDVGRGGAVIMGRRMFDHGVEPWGPEPPFRKPVFVVTNREREPLVKGETTYTFVTDGIERALELAREAAAGKEVELAGGGQIISQYLAAGLLDEILVHIVPVFLGGGAPLFEGALQDVELEVTEVVHSPRATHIRYRAPQLRRVAVVDGERVAVRVLEERLVADARVDRRRPGTARRATRARPWRPRSRRPGTRSGGCGA